MATLQRASLVLVGDCVVTSVSWSGLDLGQTGINVANNARGRKKTGDLQPTAFITRRLNITRRSSRRIPRKAPAISTYMSSGVNCYLVLFHTRYVVCSAEMTSNTTKWILQCLDGSPTPDYFPTSPTQVLGRSSIARVLPFIMRRTLA